MLLDYLFIFIYLLLSIFLTFFLYFISYFLILRTLDFEKLSIYECGFSPFEDARIKFEVKYFLVAILFIIFDLEISYLFPWAISLHFFNTFGFYIMVFFLIILTLGFIYEWYFGALDW